MVGRVYCWRYDLRLLEYKTVCAEYELEIPKSWTMANQLDIVALKIEEGNSHVVDKAIQIDSNMKNNDHEEFEDAKGSKKSPKMMLNPHLKGLWCPFL